MNKEWLESPWIISLPIVLFIVFFLAYFLSQTFLVQCWGIQDVARVGCEDVKLENVFKTGSGQANDQEGIPATTKEKDAKDRKIIAEKLGGRFVWIFSFVANLLCAFGTIGIALYYIKKWSSAPTVERLSKFASFVNKWSLSILPRERISKLIAPERWLVANCVVAICVTIALIIIALSFVFREQYMPTMTPVLDQTIRIDEAFGMGGIIGLVNFANAITFSATFIFICGLCVLAFPKAEERVLKDTMVIKKSQANKERINVALKNLLEKKNDIRIMLYAATFLLVVSIFRMNASFTWTLAFMAPEAVEGMKFFYSNFSTVLGGFFTMLLAATYLPTAYIVYERGDIALSGRPKEAPEKTPPAVKKPETQEKKADPDFKFSFVESLPKILAIAAPLLAGPIADLLKNIAPK